MRKRHYNESSKSKNSKGGFTKVHWSFFKTGLGRKVGPSAGWVLLALHSYADVRGRCYPSGKALAKLSGLSPTSVTVAKRKLRDLGLISYVIERQGKKNITYYQLQPILGQDALAAVDKISDALPVDVITYIEELKKLIRKYSADADYLRNHIEVFAGMQLGQRTVELLKKANVDMKNVRLYYALSLVHTLRVVSATYPGGTFPVKVTSNAKALAKMINPIAQMSSHLKVPFEDSILTFMSWVKRKKSDKSLHVRMLALLADEWAKGLRKKKQG